MRMVGNELAVEGRTVTLRLDSLFSVSSLLRSKAELMTTLPGLNFHQTLAYILTCAVHNKVSANSINSINTKVITDDLSGIL